LAACSALLRVIIVPYALVAHNNHYSVFESARTEWRVQRNCFGSFRNDCHGSCVHRLSEHILPSSLCIFSKCRRKSSQQPARPVKSRRTRYSFRIRLRPVLWIIVITTDFWDEERQSLYRSSLPAINMITEKQISQSQGRSRADPEAGRHGRKIKRCA
jgi:hypothetical protein